jgi:hypothetical protein
MHPDTVITTREQQNMRKSAIGIALAASLLLTGLHSTAQSGNTPPATPSAGQPTISAREGGARYGQAAGAALVCYGLRTTDEVEKLRDRFKGAELAVFDKEARKVAAAWKVTLSCEKADGPNQCRLSHVWSCRQALREIGPNGTAARGLVEPRK